MQKQMYTFIKTGGDGYWSDAKKTVLVEYLSCESSDEDDYAELCVKFNTQSWDVNTDGLIYSDSTFMKGLKAALMQNGFSEAAVNDISYSEQGMQGNNFVSCDVGADFIAAFNNCALANAVVKEEDYLDS